MKLLNLKLLSRFRSLHKGFQIKFNKSNRQEDNINSLCFVGLNGSGKSNVLEVLSEIFYYLETYHFTGIDNLNNFKTRFGFEIEYELPIEVYRDLQRGEFNKLLEGLRKLKKAINPIFKITKLPNNLPQIQAKLNKDIFILENDNGHRDPAVLPYRIIGYSSGMNELISTPFTKMDIHYFNNFEQRAEKLNISTLKNNRMFFIDNEANGIMTICNFLFDTAGFKKKDFHNKSINTEDFGGKDLTPLKRELQLIDIHSFSIYIKLWGQKRSVSLPPELSKSIELLKNCATCFEEKIERKGKEYQFYFWVNDATKQAFRENFGRAEDLFYQLYFLRLLNYNRTKVGLRKLILSAKTGTNIKALLPKHEESNKVFSVQDIAFRKNGVKDPVYYQQLSDGEHQLLHIIGLIMLIDSPGTLFLLDEPETHFNPLWRSKLVSLINELLPQQSYNRGMQEMILTTHSPFVLSDTKKENVYKFWKEKNSNEVKYKNYVDSDLQTYGTSIDILLEEFFDKDESISDLAMKEIDRITADINSLDDVINAKRELLKLGESIKKFDAYNYLNRRKKELE